MSTTELPACHQDSPQHAAYVARVKELEAEGCDTSDAQGIADMEFDALTKPKKPTKPTHKMKTYILDTAQGYATHRFIPDAWDTTQSLDDSALYTFESESLEAAIETIGESLGGIRYRRAGSPSFQDKNLNTFTVLDLAEEKAAMATSDSE